MTKYESGVVTQPLYGYQKPSEGDITVTFSGGVKITSPKEISDEVVPTPVKHVFEIWADPECTTRPTKANYVYVLVNKDLTLDDVAIYGSDNPVDADFEVYKEEYDPWSLRFKFDFLPKNSLLDAPKKGDVIELWYSSNGEYAHPIDVSNGPFSFGEIVEE